MTGLLALALMATSGGVWLVQQRAEAARQDGEVLNEVAAAVAQAASLFSRRLRSQVRRSRTGALSPTIGWSMPDLLGPIIRAI
jgi:hypothetical protein